MMSRCSIGLAMFGPNLKELGKELAFDEFYTFIRLCNRLQCDQEQALFMISDWLRTQQLDKMLEQQYFGELIQFVDFEKVKPRIIYNYVMTDTMLNNVSHLAKSSASIDMEHLKDIAGHGDMLSIGHYTVEKYKRWETQGWTTS